jgi:hypothetical protein
MSTYKHPWPEMDKILDFLDEEKNEADIAERGHPVHFPQVKTPWEINVRNRRTLLSMPELPIIAVLWLPYICLLFFLVPPIKLITLNRN